MGSFQQKITVIFAAALLITCGYAFSQQFSKKQEGFAAESGKRAPDVKLEKWNGGEQALSDSLGKGVILNFWATYCPPCKKEMPILQNSYQKYKEKGIEILAVNAGEPTVLVNRFISQNPVHFPILLDRDETAVDEYQVQNLPVTFFINSRGEIVEKVSGELTEEKLEAGIKLIKP